jgi:hypothetical protein
VVLYQLQFKLARRRMFTLRENMLFFAQWTRSFELESVLSGRECPDVRIFFVKICSDFLRFHGRVDWLG